jgi:hypothetical protein
MDSHQAIRVLIVYALLATAFACEKRVDPDVLWLPANATIEVNAISMKAARGMYKDGSADVVFKVPAPDPGDKETLATQLAQHFEHAGWHPRSTQWLNPGLAGSFSEGWRHACGCILWTDAQGKTFPPPDTFLWSGEWENQDGDVVKYSLTASEGNVRGYATYSPARLINATKRLGKRQSPID